MARLAALSRHSTSRRSERSVSAEHSNLQASSRVAAVAAWFDVSHHVNPVQTATRFPPVPVGTPPASAAGHHRSCWNAVSVTTVTSPMFQLPHSTPASFRLAFTVS
jgi:hypothetical protein